uniref:Uncharacterized protein n=1 Tax=Anguilla anguilla TaxID=7936 RepID=A0A0E9WWC7_ANGAN
MSSKASQLLVKCFDCVMHDVALKEIFLLVLHFQSLGVSCNSIDVGGLTFASFSSSDAQIISTFTSRFGPFACIKGY